ncbi:TetR family transcriptional regulator C-terminal domain-containing protein [Siansivirga zeaxanthinifaciens]|uniref:Heat-shock protein n=1 Tax=Siansivirga zeaxanthinifaciens CC-SAMT-1 TaxID=1454006 RepID=A0A0C5WFB5_9FLAO|nr:TetR family transcriptional regulator C-terminal domain-containing protein [Siansivirga zeaxanthinifaciens]AJR03899.1 heat-shock protein [Siansivirga zeaxanthinifaciens CC-SAMT-1]
MAKKKTISENDIMSLYMDYVLEHNSNPKSVYSFAKANNFDEALFYNYFGSFEAIEKHILKAFFDNAIQILDKNEDYQNFDARNKLLSFYFTFFEILTANRSYVVYALESNKKNLKALLKLSELKKAFTNYIDHLDIETLDIKQATIDKIQKKAIQESAWAQLLVTMKFWLEDTSAGIEKTDIFIEKAVNTSFDILNIAPLKSVIDFGKFLFKEKMQMN